jgi:uncharacterized protein (DUF3084 family)
MQLIKWEKIRTEIECAKDIETLTAMKNKLRAYQILAEQSKQSQEVQSKIAIYKARADRKCGEWLQVNIEHDSNQYAGNKALPALKDIGITKNESSRLQKIAAIPEDRFEGILQEAVFTSR